MNRYVALFTSSFFLFACGDDDVMPTTDSALSDAMMVDAFVVDARVTDSRVEDDATNDATVDAAEQNDAQAPTTCIKTIAMAGAFSRSDGINPKLGEYVSSLPGLIEDCEGDRCLPFFQYDDKRGLQKALLAALDENNDGKYDDADPNCELNLIGYSWGGININAVSKSFLSDTHVSASRKRIDHLVLLDPFAPLMDGKISIDERVRKVWQYRHSESPRNDCSARAPLGPYRGIPIECNARTRCREYDYSMSNASFNGVTANDVGHCSIVIASEPAWRTNITTGEDYDDLPPELQGASGN